MVFSVVESELFSIRKVIGAVMDIHNTSCGDLSQLNTSFRENLKLVFS